MNAALQPPGSWKGGRRGKKKELRQFTATLAHRKSVELAWFAAKMIEYVGVKAPLL